MYENKSAKETLEELNVDSKTGLSEEEASKRQIEYGFNKLEEKKKDGQTERTAGGGTQSADAFFDDVAGNYRELATQRPFTELDRFT